MNQKIVDEAAKLLNPIDFIMDLYDMSYVWASKTLLNDMEYTLDEFQKLRSLDLLDEKVEEQKYRKVIADLLAKKHGTTSLTLNTKSGKKIKSEIEYQIFEFDGGFYMAGKGIKAEHLS
jgi:hypothetical protein